MDDKIGRIKKVERELASICTNMILYIKQIVCLCVCKILRTHRNI